MPTIKLDLSQLAQHQQKLAENFMPAVRRGLVSGAARCLPFLHARTRAVGAVSTGAYLQQWRATATPDGAVIYNSATYAAIIEMGRRVGARMPPPSALARWAQRKLGLSETEARGVGFAMARAIKKRGLPARRVMLDGLDEMLALVTEEIVREVDAELGKP